VTRSRRPRAPRPSGRSWRGRSGPAGRTRRCRRHGPGRRSRPPASSPNWTPRASASSPTPSAARTRPVWRVLSGASLGTAPAGSVLIASLTATLLAGVQQNPAVPPEVSQKADVRLSSGAPFLSDGDLESALDKAGVTGETAAAIGCARCESRLRSSRSSRRRRCSFLSGSRLDSRHRRRPTPNTGHPISTARAVTTYRVGHPVRSSDSFPNAVARC
jgi:hypothetical protein